jgi:hypothetical protein
VGPPADPLPTAGAGRPAPNPSSLQAADAEETTITLMTTDRRARFLLIERLNAISFGGADTMIVNALTGTH